MLVGFSNFSSRFHVHDLRPLSLDYFKLPRDFHFYTKLKHSLLRNVVLTKAGSNVTFINFLVQIPSLCSAFVHYDGLFSSYLQSLLSRVDWTVQGTEFSWSRDVVVILLKWPKSSVSESCENLGKKTLFKPFGRHRTIQGLADGSYLRLLISIICGENANSSHILGLLWLWWKVPTTFLIRWKWIC